MAPFDDERRLKKARIRAGFFCASEARCGCSSTVSLAAKLLLIGFHEARAQRVPDVDIGRPVDAFHRSFAPGRGNPARDPDSVEHAPYVEGLIWLDVHDLIGLRRRRVDA